MKPSVAAVFKTGLFTPISLDRGEFVLKDTEYTIIVRNETILWKKKQIRNRTAPTRVIGDTSTPQWDSVIEPTYVFCTFEEVFDNVPEYIKERMIYHFDILKAGAPVQDGVKIRGMNSIMIHIDETVDFGEDK